MCANKGVKKTLVYTQDILKKISLLQYYLPLFLHIQQMGTCENHPKEQQIYIFFYIFFQTFQSSHYSGEIKVAPPKMQILSRPPPSLQTLAICIWNGSSWGPVISPL